MSFTLQEVYPCVFDDTAVEGVSDSGRLEPLVKQYMQESIQQQRPVGGSAWLVTCLETQLLSELVSF